MKIASTDHDCGLSLWSRGKCVYRGKKAFCDAVIYDGEVTLWGHSRRARANSKSCDVCYSPESRHRPAPVLKVLRVIRLFVFPSIVAVSRVVSLAPHSASVRANIHGPMRSPISITHRLRRWPRAALEKVQHRIRNEACPLRVDMPVAGAALAVCEESLWYYEVKLIFGARHRDIEQPTLFLYFRS